MRIFLNHKLGFKASTNWLVLWGWISITIIIYSLIQLSSAAPEHSLRSRHVRSTDNNNNNSNIKFLFRENLNEILMLKSLQDLLIILKMRKNLKWPLISLLMESINSLNPHISMLHMRFS